MKKSVLSLFVGLLTYTGVCFAQNTTRSTAAVAEPSVQGMNVTPAVAAKMFRIEF